MFGVADRIDPPGLALHLADLGELRERGHARFVDHEVLAMPHGRDAERSALARDGGADDQRDAVVFKDPARIDASRPWVPVGERLGQTMLVGVEGGQFCAGPPEQLYLAPDVGVIQTDGGEPERRHDTGRTMRQLWRTSCSGLIGVVFTSMSNGAKASQTALAMAAGGATAPPSPTPLTPSGLSGDGECW